ncbi:uncharacterized protein K02A2.6-like [Wyeomyia smithii]|uniref:uncharacterized protein K02A2.6-like n=1 Tax=Wyeomyia smithii TaxID=174621 RepID=UPI002467DC3D|nr:uncharacterized protein K02A2.6-like [Wyeomyia smithii]
MKRKHYVGNQEQNTQEGSGCDDCIEAEQNYISKPILFTINKLQSIPDKPIKVGVRIGGRNLTMELDSGAATSAVSEKFYEKHLQCFKLKEANLELVTYNGQNLSVLGCIEPVVAYSGKEKSVSFALGKYKPVPLSLQSIVNKEIELMEINGVISRCDSSEWATPIVPVLKDDGKRIRLCGDYKVTLNKVLKDVRHPLPRVEEVMSKLAGSKYFSKLDLSRAYNQFELSEKSKKLCALSTHKGVFLMNRLPFGVKPASGIVQRELEKLLATVPGVVNFLDDVLVAGKTREEHLERLVQVLKILEDAGLTLCREKCSFMMHRVRYLGFEISGDGITKTSDRIKAISEAKPPANVPEVRAFAGLVNYYSRFVKSLANLMSPLYQLLRKNQKFDWGIECQEAFKKVKNEICKDITLTHFDPNKDIVLICDASKDGISAVLAHKIDNVDRPVAFASRVLSGSEKSYSVLHKEGLAIMYGLNKYYQYLAGNKFTIKTDHNPLVSILSPQKGIPVMAAGRIQRWANFLSGFNYNLEYVKSGDNIADYPSRAPIESWELWKEDASYLDFVTSQETVLVDKKMLKRSTDNDETLTKLRKCILDGNRCGADAELVAFKNVFEELSIEDGIIMRGYRVVVPITLRNEMLRILHSSHLGINKMKSVARGSIWWPGLDYDIKIHAQQCESCALEQPSPPRAKLIPWNVPEKLMECMSRFGLVDEVVSDNGTQFTAEKFRRFLTANGIKHTLTAPGHPATNGAAENFVKSFKTSLKKSLRSRNGRALTEIICNILMGYRKSKHCSSQVAPAIAMFNRDIKSRMDLVNPMNKTCTTSDRMKLNIERSQKKQIKQYKGVREAVFNRGESVFVRDYSNPNKTAWTKAVVLHTVGLRNYIVKLDVSGRTIKRHTDQMVKDNTAVIETSEQLQREPKVKDTFTKVPPQCDVGQGLAKTEEVSYKNILSNQSQEDPKNRNGQLVAVEEESSAYEPSEEMFKQRIETIIMNRFG